MVEIEKIDDELYKALHIQKDIKKVNKIWNEIKNNEEILKQAITLTRNKWNCGDILQGLTISEMILMNYDNVNNKIYQELINIIYKNKDIARMVLDGASNGGYSFLLMSLWNDKIKLTDNQKDFAVTEAMYKIGTTLWNKKDKQFQKKIDKQGITDEQTVMVDIDGCKNLVGKKTQLRFFNYLLNSLENEQAHGTGCYDIRYCILKNFNWTVEEKQKLIMDFWYDDKEYADTLDEWEWGIINDIVNYQGEYTVILDKSDLYQYNYQELLTFYNNTQTTDKIWEEINFCRQMQQLRIPYWKVNSKDIKKKTLK